MLPNLDLTRLVDFLLFGSTNIFTSSTKNSLNIVVNFHQMDGYVLMQHITSLHTFVYVSYIYNITFM